MSDTTTIVPPPDLGTLPPIFAECVAKEKTRYAIETPWVDGGYTCATNGQIIVRLRTPDAPDTTRHEAWNFPPVASLGWGKAWTPVEMPSEIPEPLPVEECENCGGGGNCWACSCGHEHECGKCGGLGLLPQEYVTLPLIEGKVGIGDNYARLLKRFGASLFVDMGAKDIGGAPIRFTLPDGCEGLVMPRTFGKAPHAK